MIDFTNYPIDKVSKYEGSDQKRGIIYNNKRYMLKMSDRINTEKRNKLNSSYSNSVYSEHICCKIIKSLGIDVQNTLLGTLTMSSKTKGTKTVPVVACENFLNDNEELLEFKKIQNSLQSEKPGKIPKIEEIYDILGNDNPYFSKSFGEIGIQRYWDTFIIDALLGNFDRHGNNWGYIINKTTQNISIAPIYDCGSCLYPQITDDAIPDILSNTDEIQTRIDKFPTSALDIGSGIKANYKDYIGSFANKDCIAALQRIYPKIDIQKISEIVDSVEGISDIRKKFYKTMLTERYRQIIKEPYKLYTQIKEKGLEEYASLIGQIRQSINKPGDFNPKDFPELSCMDIDKYAAIIRLAENNKLTSRERDIER